MIKTLTLNHYDQTFELKMVDGSKHEVTINSQNFVKNYAEDNPYVLKHSPEDLLKRWIEYGSVVFNLNLSHVVEFTAGAIFNERSEQVIYKKHWFWGWRRDD